MITNSTPTMSHLLLLAVTLLLSPAQAITHLRILPLGDSITWGAGSTNGSGYRAPLLTLLTSPNSSFTTSKPKITYIGSLTSGNLPPPNNANEGHIGALISQIGDYAKVPLSWNGTLEGDIVLLMAGTNDMFNANISPSEAPVRLGALIDEIVTAWPKAAVLVATLTPSALNTTQDKIEVFNGQVAGVVSKRAKAGNRTLVVSMSKVTVGMEVDVVHPDDVGYTLMAQAWYKGLLEAKSKGWIDGVASGAAFMGGAGWLMWFLVVSLVLLVGV
ncbi:SGNH hydrolase-type esterase domain-containing protein [Hyaloscypha sp. PMI_1271]|nr:SGNH hydrolase-type esterase domain-containing protein [Hyaloscypha sp. PMI_1271]